MAKGTAASGQRKQISAATQALLDQMKTDTPTATPDALNAVGAKLRELRDLEINIKSMEEHLAARKARHLLIREKELVDLMDAAGMDKAGLPPAGNMPGMDVEIVDYYHANIATDWEPERRAKAFAWINKYHPGMLRNTVTVSFGKGSEKQQKALAAALKKMRIPFTNDFGVPWNTLTAFVREQIEEHRRRPPLELLGATVGRVAKIKKQKEK